MATKTKMITFLEDDLDGTEAAETVTFSIDGESWEVDLNEKNARRLRASLEPYKSSGRKVNGRRVTKTKAVSKNISKPKAKATQTVPKAPKVEAKNGTSRKRTATRGPAPKQVRAWAVEQGMEVPSHGRIPQKVRAAYDAAHATK